MQYAQAERMLSEADLNTVSGGHTISATLERFAAANAEPDDANNALVALVTSVKAPPTGRKR